MSSIATPSRISARRLLVTLLALVLVASVVTWYWAPELVRRLVVAHVHALTDRPVSIEGVGLNILTGRLTVRGFRLGERAGSDQGDAFVAFERLAARVSVPSLLLGRVWIREAELSGPTVRVVRQPNGDFNLSDLLGRPATPGRPLHLTIDRFSLKGGLVTLEDRALPERRTWASEHITIEARNVSTQSDGGSALARSVTAGAPVLIEVKNLRLNPVHLQATMTTEGLDLALARVYLPPDAPLVLERGRASSSVTVVFDAREGLRADATGRFEDVVLIQPGESAPLALVPRLTTHVRGFAFREGALRVGQFAAEGTMSVRDPTAKPGARLRLSSVRASVDDLTWPATTAGRLDLLTSIPGGGTLAVAGTIRPPPASTQLRMRVADLDLAPWTRLLPVAARVTGLAQADLRIDEPIAADVPARIRGTVAVNRLGVADGRQERLGARRIEASGLELHWPERLMVGRVLVSGPRGVVERDRDGGFPLKDLLTPRPAPMVTRSREHDETPGVQPLAVEVGEIRVQDGAAAWRDEAVSPPARLSVSGLAATITGAGWPLRGPLGVRAALHPPGGGQLSVSGRVALDPLAADLRVIARNAELAPYHPYLATPARVSGAADLDVAVVMPSVADGRAQVRGTAGLSRLDVRDGERTVMRLERATATGVDAEWPERVAIARLAVAQPWILVERDDKGALPLRGLLTPRPARGGSAPATHTENGGTVAITVAQLVVDQGGMRVVDRAVSPPFAVDLQSAAIRIQGFSTVEAKPARIELTGRVGPSADLALKGTMRAVGDRPFLMDVTGELRGFAVPRTNPYIQQVGWKTNEGSLTSKLQWRIDGDALTARTDLRVSHLQVVPAAARDEAQARIGLPLGLLTTLMKDRRGDITLSIPVAGRLSDPRFDFSEAIWGAVRTVAVNAIMLPVSWIGRVQLSDNSRIQRIQVDPIPFPAGTDTLTPDAQERVARLAAFLERLPEVRMAVTPVVSSGDVTELQRPKREAARPVPSTREPTPAAVAEREPTSTSDVADLGKARVAAVRTALKRAGVDAARLPERPLVQREDAEGHIALDVLEPETQRPSKVRGILEKLGVPLKPSVPSSG